MTYANKIEDLLAKQDIYDCVMRYARGTDRHDIELIRSTYHPDALDDHGHGERTVEEFLEMVRQSDHVRTWVHHIGNMLIELHGDVALVETYWIAYQAWDESDGTKFIRARSGRYADTFTKRDGEWRVSLRRVIDDWSNVQPVTSVIDNRSIHVGAPHPHDPIYTMQNEVEAAAADR